MRYSTQEGTKAAYLTVSFIRAEGRLHGQPVVIERPFEFFMLKPTSAATASSGLRRPCACCRWPHARMGSVAKALADMREVVWEKGPVRCGSITREDGTEVPAFHDSEVGAIAFMLQRVLIRRGFLDRMGNQVPVADLARQLARITVAAPSLPPAPSQRTASRAIAQVPRVRRSGPAQGRWLQPLRRMPLHRQLRMIAAY
ncbi:hypothetical protein LP419_34760 [Massilia sp. H-1]|nr:hypothetical protein LP419_34760 [Massilia sp. H-1]